MYNIQKKPKIYSVHFDDGRVWDMDEAEFYVWFHSHKSNDYVVYKDNEIVGPFIGNTKVLTTDYNEMERE